jgi:hypothetical protein
MTEAASPVKTDASEAIATADPVGVVTDMSRTLMTACVKELVWLNEAFRDLQLPLPPLGESASIQQRRCEEVLLRMPEIAKRTDELTKEIESAISDGYRSVCLLCTSMIGIL